MGVSNVIHKGTYINKKLSFTHSQDMFLNHIGIRLRYTNLKEHIQYKTNQIDKNDLISKRKHSEKFTTSEV